MKIKFKLITSILIGALFFFTSCEERELLYESYDPMTADGTNTIVVGNASRTIVVDAADEKRAVQVSAKLWGPVSSSDITIPFVVDETNLSDEAYDVEGSSIVIPAGKTSASVTINLYPAEMFPGEIFTIKYSLGNPSVGEISDLGGSGTITTYNPGFMGPWVGEYEVHAASYGEPGDWDEAWSVTTELNPDDPLNSILMHGIGGGTAPIYAIIDYENETITIPAGQHCGDAYGYGNIGVVFATPEFDFDADADLTGTANAETGEIKIDNWGMLLLEGAYAGYKWDVFNTTFTKTAKKDASTYIPKYKKPRQVK